MGGKPRARGLRTPLLVVDVQRGFLNEFTRHLPARVARLAGTRRFHPIYFTRFENPPGGPYRRFLDWHGCEKPPETELAPEVARFGAAERVFSKPGHAGLPDALAGVLKDAGVERVTVVGIDTDMCVLKVVMDLFDLAIEPIVLVDCCASTAGLQAHLAALAVLSRNIGAARLRDAGLGEGQLAAPD
ncbi:MAG TPA: isochorismatase family cysteine hydrolase [Kofleriaceae bacterium]|nr:isochorismatase family cysteine hydrolase [Kofleriaceae bacterium]